MGVRINMLRTACYLKLGMRGKKSFGCSFVFFRGESTCAVHYLSTGCEHRCGNIKQHVLALGAHQNVFNAPLADCLGVFSKHSLA